jgi:hypothetical protein
LLVFDNFETVKNPVELFVWLDTFVRLPNKILITTRFREFKGDYPIEVTGMTEGECAGLVSLSSKNLGIESIVTDDYAKQVIAESEGHPYVIKVLLGEVAKAKSLVKIDRIIATKDDILEALFERTYSSLSPVAKRIFLTLSSWRSIVPRLALETVLMRPENDRMDVESGIEELARSSFIEITTSNNDKEQFISVPLAASLFGSKKLSVDTSKIAIEIDSKILQYFGAAQATDVRHGLRPRVEKLFKHVAERVGRDQTLLAEYLPMIEFISRKYPPAWLLLASLYEELDADQMKYDARVPLRKYLEQSLENASEVKRAWERVSTLCRRKDDITGEVHALVELSQLPGVSFNVISDAVNRINAIFKDRNYIIDTEEKKHIIDKLIVIMEHRSSEADATDCSRLAWLFLNIHNEDKALIYTNKGLGIDPDNDYCRRLYLRFNL